MNGTARRAILTGTAGLCVALVVGSPGPASASPAAIPLVASSSIAGADAPQLALSSEGRLWVTQAVLGRRRIRLTTRNLPGGLPSFLTPRTSAGYAIRSYALGYDGGGDRAIIAWAASRLRRAVVQFVRCTPYACGRLRTVWRGTASPSRLRLAAVENGSVDVLLWSTGARLMSADGELDSPALTVRRLSGPSVSPTLRLVPDGAVQAAWRSAGQVDVSARTVRGAWTPVEHLGAGGGDVRLTASAFDVTAAWLRGTRSAGSVVSTRRSPRSARFARAVVVDTGPDRHLVAAESPGARAVVAFERVRDDGAQTLMSRTREACGSFSPAAQLDPNTSGALVAAADASETLTVAWTRRVGAGRETVYRQAPPEHGFGPEHVAGKAASRAPTVLAAGADAHTAIVWNGPTDSRALLLGSRPFGPAIDASRAC